MFRITKCKPSATTVALIREGIALRTLITLLCLSLTSAASAAQYVGTVQLGIMRVVTRGLGTPPDGSLAFVPIMGEVVFNHTGGNHIAWERVTMLPIEPVVFDRNYEGLEIRIDTTVEEEQIGVGMGNWNLLPFNELEAHVNYEPTGLQDAEIYAASRISRSGMMHRVLDVDFSEFPERIFVDLDSGVYGDNHLEPLLPTEDFYQVPDTSLRINSFQYWATYSKGTEFTVVPEPSGVLLGLMGLLGLRRRR